MGQDEKMKTRRVVDRTVAIGLGIVCLVLVAGLVGAVSFYSMAINDKNEQYDSYVASQSHNDSEYNTLVSQNTSFQAQVNSLQAPEVWKVNLEGNDVYLPSQTSHLHIYGYLFNAGTRTATGVRLHLVLYSLDYVANDTYVDVVSIGGRTWTSIDANVYYDGSFGFLTGWAITPQWTT
jgi:hypothetical protein